MTVDAHIERELLLIKLKVPANQLAALTTNKDAINTVYNIAYGESNSLNQLYIKIQNLLKKYDNNVTTIQATYTTPRIGDIRNSLASIEKAEMMLGYQPTHNLEQGLEDSIQWYWDFEQKLLLQF